MVPESPDSTPFEPEPPSSEGEPSGIPLGSRKAARRRARQAAALGDLADAADPKSKSSKSLVKSLVGYMMLGSSVVLGGYEFLSYVIEQWERREMIANWVEVAREMQDVENAPDVALELLERADEVDPQSTAVVKLRAYVRGMQTVKRLLQLDRPFNAEDVAAANLAAAEASLLEQLDPNAPDWALLRGQLAAAQHEPVRARGYFARALELDPRNSLVRVRLADMHFDLGQGLAETDAAAAAIEHETAARLLDEAGELEPTSKWIPLYKGIHALALGNLEQAAVAFDNAIAIDPRLELAIRNRGLVLFQQEDWLGAESALRRALEVDPNSVGALGMLAQVYGWQDQYEAALLYARKATVAAPTSLMAWSVAGDLNRDLGTIALQAGKTEESTARYAEAIDCYGNAIELNPRNADVLLERSKLYRRSGELEMSGRDARQATELAPKDPNTWYALAEYQLAIREFAAAGKSADTAIMLEPKFDFAYRIKSSVLEESGDFDGASAALDVAVEMASDDQRADLLHSRAEFLERRGATEQALRDAVAARTDQPEEFDHWLHEAQLLVLLGRNSDACSALAEANQRKPGAVEVSTLRAKAGCL